MILYFEMEKNIYIWLFIKIIIYNDFFYEIIFYWAILFKEKKNTTNQLTNTLTN